MPHTINEHASINYFGAKHMFKGFLLFFKVSNMMHSKGATGNFKGGHGFCGHRVGSPDLLHPKKVKYNLL